MTETTIGLLHPGEMGAAVGAVLRGAGCDVVWASAGRSPATARRAAAADLDDAGTMDELSRRAGVILSVCPPHAALEVEPDLGVLLPCNVAVYATDKGTRVTAINAGAMLGMVGNERLGPIADEVQARLDRVLQSL